MPPISIKETFERVYSRLIDPEVRQKAYIVIATVIMSLISLGSAILVYATGVPILGNISILFFGYFAILTVLEFILLEKFKMLKEWPFEAAFVVACMAMVVFCHLYAPRTGAYFFWIIIFPLIFTMAFNWTRGTIYSALLLLILVFFAYVPFFNDMMKGADADDSIKRVVKVFLIIDYIMVYGVALCARIISSRIISKLSNLKDVYYQDANTDITTGLRNQAYFLSYVNRLPSVVEKGDSIGLMFIDIDDFKIFNDKFGHTVGNEILVTVANKLNEVPHALCVRWGGDEFAIVERNITRDEFIAKANYLLKSVEGLGKQITISIGLAYYTVDEHFDFDKIFNEADMQAIRAKGKGKNCIVIKE